MKKQTLAALAAAIFIGGLTACGNDNAADPSSNALPGGFAEATPVPQGGEANPPGGTEKADTKATPFPQGGEANPDCGTEKADAEATPLPQGGEANPDRGTEKPDAETKRAVYGEAEIPDIPIGTGSEGMAGIVWQFDPEKQKLCLESMVFETHTMGDYTVSLVGDLVRTDEANYPGSIYTRNLRAEAEKNGIKIQGSGGYSGLLLYVGQQREYRLFSEKLGSYLDLYELEYPVIAMRYYYEESPARLVTRAVDFAYIQEDKIYSNYVGECEAGTGVDLNQKGGSSRETALCVNDQDGRCRASVFAADEFQIVDQKTLADEEAGIRYIFQFSNPSQMELYKAEKIK